MSDVETPDAAAPETPPEQATVHGAPSWERAGQTVVFCAREQYVDVLQALAGEGFTMCIDVCGVDYLHCAERELPAGVAAERFEVVVNLLSMEQRRRVRIRVQVPENDPTVPSLFGLWPGTEAMEREAWDMYGIAFDGHPDLTRILMPEDWEGHPLRKDYAIGRVPVQFKAPNQARR
ncbi:MAG TPA: NADH-quinone oxidoreductase subunit C [Acidimicrobiales bacterium]